MNFFLIFVQKGEVEFRLPVPGLVFQVGLDIMVIEPIYQFCHAESFFLKDNTF